MANKPAYRCYSVIKREPKPDGENNDFWLNLGVAYAHEDNLGFNILLQALPVDAKLVLRVYKESEEEPAPPPKAKVAYKK